MTRLAVSDLPFGFEIRSQSSRSSGVSSKDPSCARLVELMNPDVPQGSRASAKISVYGGQSGPLMDEEIDATGSAGAMEAWQASLKSAVAACGQVSITISGVGSSLSSSALIRETSLLE